jgi:hypothetical protein
MLLTLMVLPCHLRVYRSNEGAWEIKWGLAPTAARGFRRESPAGESVRGLRGLPQRNLLRLSAQSNRICARRNFRAGDSVSSTVVVHIRHQLLRHATEVLRRQPPFAFLHSTAGSSSPATASDNTTHTPGLPSRRAEVLCRHSYYRARGLVLVLSPLLHIPLLAPAAIKELQCSLRVSGSCCPLKRLKMPLPQFRQGAVCPYHT